MRLRARVEARTHERSAQAKREGSDAAYVGPGPHSYTATGAYLRDLTGDPTGPRKAAPQANRSVKAFIHDKDTYNRYNIL